jgi:hypothetical protein
LPSRVTVTLADVIRQRERLSPREAVTLTLAVGREWDCCRAQLGDVALPPPDAIQLQQSGEIRFSAITAPSGPVSDSPLVTILAELLGLDSNGRPTQPIPGGLMITMSGRLGSMELPSVNDCGFRAALARFGSHDPRALRKVFWRLAAAERRRTDVAFSTDVYPDRRRHPDRRAQARVVTELRRQIRQFEREAFENRGHRSRRTQGDVIWSQPRRVVPALSFVTIGVLVVIAVTALEPVPRATAQSVPRPAVAAPADDVREQTGTPTITDQAPARVSTVAQTTVREPRPTVRSRKRNPLPRQPQVHVNRVLVGGTRGIAWLR